MRSSAAASSITTIVFGGCDKFENWRAGNFGQHLSSIAGVRPHP
jgi:hypothetical protein